MSNDISNIARAQPAQRAEAVSAVKTRNAEVRDAVTVAVRQEPAEIRQTPVPANRSEPADRPRAREAVAVVDLKTEIQRVSREIDLHVDPESDDIVVRVVDRETGELVRQIPSEELLELARNLHELREQAVSEDIPVADAVGDSAGHAKEGLLIHTKA